jgi:arylsulfatase A-like enzyme
MHLPHEPSVDLYDANLRWADWGIGEVVKALRERDLLDNTILVVTSDHGEAFGEHGYIWHSRAVYGEFVHIPLLIRFPGPPNGGLVGEVGALTGTVDLLPTMLDLFQVPYPRESIQGLSVLPLLSGERTNVHDYAFARSVDAWQSYLVRNLDWSLILYRGGEFKALYDLRTDPGELRNVIGRFRPKAAAEERRSLEVAGKMSTALQRFGDAQRLSLAEFISPHAVVKAPGSNPAGPVPGKLPEEVRRKIRALGYLD